ncbi:MAG: type II and III secretion system protein [candidate division Zixibacteria bacterium]|nr:type II and III secretion system protein [candidate division Zixibacteria bacterium]
MRFHWTILVILVMSLLAGTAISNSNYSDIKLSLELQDVSIPAVLDMIAEQHNLNIVISENVTGNVTLRLENVDLNTALEAILGPMGYNYFIRDEVIIVKPYDAYASGEMESYAITLKYITPATAKMAVEPILSNKGKTVVLDKKDDGGGSVVKYCPNRLLIVDFPNVINEIKALLANLDQPERVVSIKVRIIETKVNDKSNIGFSWPTSLSAILGKSNSTEGESSTDNSGAITYDPNSGDFTWATLSVGQVQLALDLLKESGDSKLISDPHLTTLENHEAVIKIETIVPIATINRFTEGAATSDIVTFQDEEVGISLTVLPRINEGGRITLEVMPKIEDIIGYAGPDDNRKPITTSRSIQTIITVNDGETAVLGGLIKKDEIETIHQLPLLGHIPLLGKLLFSHSSKEKTTTDLTIMITPHIQ